LELIGLIWRSKENVWIPSTIYINKNINYIIKGAQTYSLAKICGGLRSVMRSCCGSFR